jgi:hypothetical protein
METILRAQFQGNQGRFATQPKGYDTNNDTNQATLLVSLERAHEQRDAGLPEVKTDPLLKNPRHDPRYNEFLQKMRLPT